MDNNKQPKVLPADFVFRYYTPAEYNIKNVGMGKVINTTEKSKIGLL